MPYYYTDWDEPDYLEPGFDPGPDEEPEEIRCWGCDQMVEVDPEEENPVCPDPECGCHLYLDAGYEGREFPSCD